MTQKNMAFPLEGGCDCREVRYRMETAPLFVIESDRVTPLSGKPALVDTPSQSAMGQQIARCPKCRIALWSHYAGAGAILSFVRVGTLDEPDHLPPDIHIFAASKQSWVLTRRRHAFLPQLEAYQAALKRKRQ